MARRIRFETMRRKGTSGQDATTSSAGYFVKSYLYTADNHDINTDPNDLRLDFNNIEIMATDRALGESSQSVSSSGDDNQSASILEQVVGNISLDILFKSGRNMEKYYKLRDRFINLWGKGMFTLNIHVGNFHGGDMYVDGYLSAIQYKENTDNVVNMSATFTPISPLYFIYGGPTNSPWLQCPTISGTVADKNGMINTNYIEASSISDVGADGFHFKFGDGSDPMVINEDYITADDFAEEPDYYSIVAGILYAYSNANGLIGTINIPKNLLAFGMSSSANVQYFRYAERYTAFDID